MNAAYEAEFRRLTGARVCQHLADALKDAQEKARAATEEGE